MRPANLFPLPEDNADMCLAVKCNFCDEMFREDETVKTPEGYLCPKCNELYCQQEADNLREQKFQDRLDTLDTDDLLTLKLIVTCYYEGQSDKSGSENIVRWSNRAQIALDSKRHGS